MNIVCVTCNLTVLCNHSDNESDKSDTSDSDFEPEKEGRSNGAVKRNAPGKQVSELWWCFHD